MGHKDVSTLVYPSLKMSAALSTVQSNLPLRSPTFISLCKEKGVAALVNHQLSSNEDQTNYAQLKDVTITKVSTGLVNGRLIVKEGHCNNAGTMFGGFSASLVDAFGTLAIMTHDREKVGVSLDMNQTYMGSAVPGDEITIEAICPKHGRRVAFADVTIKKNGRNIVAGRHT